MLKACDFSPIEEKYQGLIWNYRYPLIKDKPESIIKILLSVNWNDTDQSDEAIEILEGASGSLKFEQALILISNIFCANQEY